jgi:lipopolysaccharide/colanic/teichoic acid biosynthesis glycosyltransferase
MGLYAPTSKARFRARLALPDLLWALVAPLVAIALRNPDLLDASGFPQGLPPAYQYAAATLVCAIPAFLLFRISDGLEHLFSVEDALAVCAAVLAAVAASSLLLFILTRLEGVPRSTPIIYGLVLGGGLMAHRAAARVFNKGREPEVRRPSAVAPQKLRRVIVIGADRFAALTIKLVDHQRPRTTQIVAALDPRVALLGRSIAGVKVIGAIQDLANVLDEYAVHGVDIDEVWLSDDLNGLGDAEERARELCAARSLKFARIAEALNLTPQGGLSSMTWDGGVDEADAPSDYFKLKRAIDIVASMGLLAAAFPVAVAAFYLALLDVGAPAIFWQERIGRNGRKFFLYKFRTYRAPFGKDGAPLPEHRRLSALGRLMRTCRLDELPQLLNVLVGDMSLIGPRPLLPRDQPGDPRIRLSVRPGITGWAQINGGTRVTPGEKDALDAWYIRHASLWLDLKIALYTLRVGLTGEALNPAAVSEALRFQRAKGAAGSASAAEPLPRASLPACEAGSAEREDVCEPA